MNAIKENRFWKDFIEMYRDHPELWNTVNPGYKNREMKNKAWDEMLTKYKEVDSSATLDVVKRKCISLRSSYRRELQKIRRSERSGASDGEVYVPILWYYKDLSFLQDHTRPEGMSTVDMDTDTDTSREDELLKPLSTAKKRKLCNINDFLDTTTQPLDESNETQRRDEVDIFAESWAIMFRKLSCDQRIHAKRAIEEILWQGQLGLLCIDTTRSLTTNATNQYHQYNQ